MREGVNRRTQRGCINIKKKGFKKMTLSLSVLSHLYHIRYCRATAALVSTEGLLDEPKPSFIFVLFSHLDHVIEREKYSRIEKREKKKRPLKPHRR